MDRTSLSCAWLAGWGAGWLAGWAQRASKDTGVPAVGNCCFVFLSGNFGPRGTLGLQLSGTVWSFRLEISGLGAPAVRYCVFFCVWQLRAPGDPAVGLLSCFFLDRPGEAQRGQERPREARRGPEKPTESQRRTERRREGRRGPERLMLCVYVERPRQAERG